MDRSLTVPGASPDLLGLIHRRGWPLTKAAYVAAMYDPESPPFPLDAETLARVPVSLPGAVPSSPMDLLFPESSSSSEDAPSTPPNGRPALPEPLVASVMERHGFSRAEALDELEKTAV